MATSTIKGKYEGYLWESDKQEPQTIYEDDNLLEEYVFDSEKNPFIIEGLLFDRTTGHSVSIKYVDGEYKIKEYIVKTTDDGKVFFDLGKDVNGEGIRYEIRDLHFKGNNKLKGNNLHFYELWEEKQDPLCCKMKVLEATKVIFAGFSK